MYALEYQITTHTKDTRNIEAHRREKKMVSIHTKIYLKEEEEEISNYSPTNKPPNYLLFEWN